MFNDLKVRAQLKAKEVSRRDSRVDEVKWLFKKVVEEAFPEIESLGFVNVEFFKYDSNPKFTLRICSRRGYSQSSFTHNIELGSIKNVIYYGCGANSARGKEMEFDYNWNDSKLVATMKSVLRATVGEALNSMEFIKAKGW
ncbi:hypothetical protein D3C81_587380 [compost metagenome]